MKLMELCETTCVPMVLYDGHYGVEFARIDGKNGVVEKVLDCYVSYIGLNDNMLHVETDFSVYHFISDWWSEISDLVIDSYINYTMLKGSESIFKPGKTKIIHKLKTPYGVDMYSVSGIVYDAKEFKAYILSDDEFLLHITKNWNCYELEWDL